MIEGNTVSQFSDDCNLLFNNIEQRRQNILVTRLLFSRSALRSVIREVAEKCTCTDRKGYK